MDATITPQELRELSPKLSDDDSQNLAEQLNAKVDELIGEEIVDSLTPDDVEILATMQSGASEQELASWIIEHVPDYPEIIQNNRDIVLGDYADTLSDDE